MTNKRVKRSINKELMFNKIMPSYPTPVQTGYYRDNGTQSYDRASLRYDKPSVGMSDEILKQGTAYVNRDAAVHTPSSPNQFPFFPHELNNTENKQNDPGAYSQNQTFSQNNSISNSGQYFSDNQPGSTLQQNYSRQPEIQPSYMKNPDQNNIQNQNSNDPQMQMQKQFSKTPDPDFSSETSAVQYNPSLNDSRYLQAFIQQMAEQGLRSSEASRTATKTAVQEKKEPDDRYNSYERAKLKDELKDLPKYINITKQIVYSNVEEMMKKFNCCTCDMCKQAVILNTLNNVKSEYVYKKPSEIKELIASKDISEINKQLIRTIVSIKANSPHKR